MTPKGFHHIGVATLDLDRTRDFYENILGFPAVRCDTIRLTDGGQIRHIFLDTGRDQLLAFMELRNIPGIGEFDAGTEAALEEKRQALLAKGVKVSPVIDHDWAKSIYFKDPNGIQLEFCTYTREFTDEDAVMKVRFEATLKALDLEENVVIKALT